LLQNFAQHVLINAHSVKISSKSKMVEPEIGKQFVDLTRNDPLIESFWTALKQLLFKILTY